MLGYSFVDVDKYIEKQQGDTVFNIFETKGEVFFRYIECEALREIALLDNDCVIATGGGTSCFYSNIDFMNSNGTTVYLRLNVATLVSRLMNERSERPLIASQNETEVNDHILSMLNVRKKFYEKAQIVLDADSYTTDEVAEMIRDLVQCKK